MPGDKPEYEIIFDPTKNKVPRDAQGRPLDVQPPQQAEVQVDPNAIRSAGDSVKSWTGDLLEGALELPTLPVDVLSTILEGNLPQKPFAQNLRERMGIPREEGFVPAVRRAAAGGLTGGLEAKGLRALVPSMAKREAINLAAETAAGTAAGAIGQLAQEYGAGPWAELLAAFGGGAVGYSAVKRLTDNAVKLGGRVSFTREGAPVAIIPDENGVETAYFSDMNGEIDTSQAPRPGVGRETPEGIVGPTQPLDLGNFPEAGSNVVEFPSKPREIVQEAPKITEDQAKDFLTKNKYITAGEAADMTEEEAVGAAQRLGYEPPVGGGGGAGGGEPPKPFDVQDVTTRLTEAFDNARNLNKEQAKLYSQARSERIKNVLERQRTTEGEQGLHAELGELKGELPKVNFEPVRGDFTERDITGLFEHVKSDNRLSPFQKINARVGLAKLLDGQVPTQSELSLLGRLFPAEFVKAALRHRKTGQKLLDAAGNALNMPRSLMSSFDLSAPFRQGVFLIHRPEYWKAFPQMFKAFGSDKAYEGLMSDIYTRKTYPLMEQAKLQISELGHNLTDREEAFVSTWAERIPGVGRGVKASERAYTGFLNKLRADTFDSLVKNAQAAGIDFNENPKALEDIASFINNATGRGDLGSLSGAGPILNGLFFSPRLMASRFNMLNPIYYAKLDPFARKEAVKALLAFSTIATTVLGLANMGGADVEMDPRSSDFAKIKNGNTRYDILGGFQQYIRLGAQLLTNERKTLRGETQKLTNTPGSSSRLDVLGRFFRSKASPVASFVGDYLAGANVVGEPFDAKSAVVQRFIPLFLQDVYDLVKDKGNEGYLDAIPGAFGVGVQTYPDMATVQDYHFSGDVQTELDRLSEKNGSPVVSFPSDSVKFGEDTVKLDPEKHKEYVSRVGQMVNDTLLPMLNTPEWKAKSDEEKIKEIKDIATEMRKYAREDMFTPEDDGGEQGYQVLTSPSQESQ